MRIENNKAVGYWIIVSVFLVFLMAMTFLFLRDGAPEGISEPLMTVIFGVFWLGGIGIATFTFSKPRVLVAVEHDRLRVVLRYPYKTFRRAYYAGDIREVDIVESKDSEGDPYFIVQISLSDGMQFNLAEGHQRAECERVMVDFNHFLKR